MSTRQIIITKEVTITAEGKRNHKNCIPVLKIKGKNKDGQHECWKKYDSFEEAKEANGLKGGALSYQCSDDHWAKITAMDVLTKDKAYYCKVEDIPQYMEKFTLFFQQMFTDHLIAEDVRQEEQRKREEEKLLKKYAEITAELMARGITF
jgi:CRISPR/Cas system CSM-associated protein Csm3 (group 7 of RAMP superfamily)